jgi:hypothetical protein
MKNPMANTPTVVMLALALAGCATLLPADKSRWPVGRASAAGSTDVTAHVEVLGNPYEATYPGGQNIYARNIWDLCAFNGELLVGAGNSSNIGPAQNAGPVPVLAFSPSNGHFRIVSTVDDEQIDVFRVLNGTVYIPGHDPRESWASGNYYCFEEDGHWRKFRNIPSGVHNYDMTASAGTLFAGLGTPEGAAVAVSTDSGATWTNMPIANSRVYAFVTVGQDVYATGALDTTAVRGKKGTAGTKTGIYHYEGASGFRPRTDLGPRQLFPGVTVRPTGEARIARSVSFADHAAYLGAYCHNDHQFMPFGAFVVESLREGNVSIRQVPLPGDSRAWDLLSDNNTLYVLTDSPDSEGTTVRVTASPNGVDWVEIMHFRSRTFARSFALLNGDFYFGLGCEVADPGKWTLQELPPETGRILRVQRDCWKL